MVIFDLSIHTFLDVWIYVYVYCICIYINIYIYIWTLRIQPSWSRYNVTFDRSLTYSLLYRSFSIYFKIVAHMYICVRNLHCIYKT